MIKTKDSNGLELRKKVLSLDGENRKNKKKLLDHLCANLF